MVVISTALHFPAVLLWQMGALVASVLTYLLTMFMSLRIDANNRIEQNSQFAYIQCVLGDFVAKVRKQNVQKLYSISMIIAFGKKQRKKKLFKFDI